MEAAFLEYLGTWSYAGLFIVLLAAGFGLPLPEDIPLVLSGYLVSEAHGDAINPLILMILTGLAGVMAGDSATYWLGRYFGPGIVEKRWFRRIAKPWLIERAKEKYTMHGAKVLFASRFMPGLRCIMFMMAGVFKIPYWKLVAYNGGAALLSIPLLIYLGWKFGKTVINTVREFGHVVGGLIIAALLGYIFYEYWHNFRKKSHERTTVNPRRSAEILESAPSETGEPSTTATREREAVATGSDS